MEGQSRASDRRTPFPSDREEHRRREDEKNQSSILHAARPIVERSFQLSVTNSAGSFALTNAPLSAIAFPTETPRKSGPPKSQTVRRLRRNSKMAGQKCKRTSVPRRAVP